MNTKKKTSSGVGKFPKNPFSVERARGVKNMLKQDSNMESRSGKRMDKKEKFTITRGKYKGITLYLESNTVTRPTKALVKKSFFDTMQCELQNRIFIECFAGSGQMGFEALSVGAKKVVFFEKDSKAYKNLSQNITLFLDKKRSYDSKDTLYDISNLDQSRNHVVQSYCIDFFQCLRILEQDILTSSINQDRHSYRAKNAIITQELQDVVVIQNENKDSKKLDSKIHCDIESGIILYLDPPFSCREGFINIYDEIWRFVQSFGESLLQKVDMIIIESMSGVCFKEMLGDFRLSKVSKFGKTTLQYYKK